MSHESPDLNRQVRILLFPKESYSRSSQAYLQVAGRRIIVPYTELSKEPLGD